MIRNGGTNDCRSPQLHVVLQAMQGEPIRKQDVHSAMCGAGRGIVRRDGHYVVGLNVRAAAGPLGGSPHGPACVCVRAFPVIVGPCPRCIVLPPGCRDSRVARPVLAVARVADESLEPGKPKIRLLFVPVVAMAEWLACSPPAKTNLVQSPAGSLRIFASGNRAGRCRWSAGRSPVSPALSFRRCSIPHFILIGPQDLDVREPPKSLHSLTVPEIVAPRYQRPYVASCYCVPARLANWFLRVAAVSAAWPFTCRLPTVVLLDTGSLRLGNPGVVPCGVGSRPLDRNKAEEYLWAGGLRSVAVGRYPGYAGGSRSKRQTLKDNQLAAGSLGPWWHSGHITPPAILANLVRFPAGSLLNFHLHRTMPVGWFSRGFPVSPAFLIPVLLNTHLASPSSAVMLPVFEPATVAERLARSPPTKANRAQSPAGSPDFHEWESCFLGELPFPSVPSFPHCSIFTSTTLVGSQDLAWLRDGLAFRRVLSETVPRCRTRPIISRSYEETGSGGLRRCGRWNIRAGRRENAETEARLLPREARATSSPCALKSFVCKWRMKFVLIPVAPSLLLLLLTSFSPPADYSVFLCSSLFHYSPPALLFRPSCITISRPRGSTHIHTRAPRIFAASSGCCQSIPYMIRPYSSPHTEANRIRLPAGSPSDFRTWGNLAGRCLWSAGFLGDLPFAPPVRSGATTTVKRGEVWSSAGMKVRGETGEPREDQSTIGIVPHESHMRKSGTGIAGNRTRFSFEGGGGRFCCVSCVITHSTTAAHDPRRLLWLAIRALSAATLAMIRKAEKPQGRLASRSAERVVRFERPALESYSSLAAVALTAWSSRLPPRREPGSIHGGATPGLPHGDLPFPPYSHFTSPSSALETSHLRAFQTFDSKRLDVPANGWTTVCGLCSEPAVISRVVRTAGQFRRRRRRQECTSSESAL
ncbi:hypothetical protein PR048_033386 [Dryococelus australis]|uniref:Uncharacterized protein n=1 Tax=Dryococelus australis TaxID=614101 RepID=A0ABQ9G124_9NEOP|nr:hypothetical protein PR048_033386 [Dryococelus australis]